MFHIAYDVMLSTSQLIELSALKVRIFKMFALNLLDANIRDSNTLEVFKNKLLGVIRPIKKSVYNVYNIAGTKKLTKLWVSFSPLNEHRFRHSFDCLSPHCAFGADNEYKELCKLLLYRDSKLNLIANRIIIETTILFIERSSRFDISSSWAIHSNVLPLLLLLFFLFLLSPPFLINFESLLGVIVFFSFLFLFIFVNCIHILLVPSAVGTRWLRVFSCCGRDLKCISVVV